METYSWKQNRGGREEPNKIDDHAVDALRYALMGEYAAEPTLGLESSLFGGSKWYTSPTYSGPTHEGSRWVKGDTRGERSRWHKG
jgi:hypothetical protein